MNQHARLEQAPIPFIDVAAQRRRLGRAIDDAIARVLAHCQFILGPEVRAFEARARGVLRRAARDRLRRAAPMRCVLVLMARAIGPGDAVICPAFTFCATAEVVALLRCDAGVRRRRRGDASISIRRALTRAVATREAAWAASRRRSSRSTCSACRRITMPSPPSPQAQDCSCSTTPRRPSARPTRTAGSACSRRRRRRASFRPSRSAATATAARCLTDDDELAALIKQPARARRGRRQIRQRAHRHQRPARHHPGRGADREAEDLSRGDRRARARGAALHRRARRRRDRAAGRRRLDLGVGAIHHPARGRPARRARRRAARRRAFRPRSIIPSRCTGRPPTGTSRWPRAACR